MKQILHLLSSLVILPTRFLDQHFLYQLSSLLHMWTFGPHSTHTESEAILTRSPGDSDVQYILRSTFLEYVRMIQIPVVTFHSKSYHSFPSQSLRCFLPISGPGFQDIRCSILTQTLAPQVVSPLRARNRSKTMSTSISVLITSSTI